MNFSFYSFVTAHVFHGSFPHFVGKQPESLALAFIRQQKNTFFIAKTVIAKSSHRRNSPSPKQSIAETVHRRNSPSPKQSIAETVHRRNSPSPKRLSPKRLSPKRHFSIITIQNHSLFSIIWYYIHFLPFIQHIKWVDYTEDFRPGLKTHLGIGLKFWCDHMVDFIPGCNLSSGAKRWHCIAVSSPSSLLKSTLYNRNRRIYKYCWLRMLTHQKGEVVQLESHSTYFYEFVIILHHEFFTAVSSASSASSLQ